MRMIESVLTVGQQVIILFILIGVGFFCAKVKFLNKESIKGIINLILYIVTPCVIVNSFHREYDVNSAKGLMIAVIVAVFVHILNILLANLFVRDKIEARRRVLHNGVVFSNCAFMSIPLQVALLGSEGVFYAAGYIGVFNIFLWTYGLISMSGDRHIDIKKIILNPGIIGVLIGAIIFFAQIHLPDIIDTPMEYLAELNTPLPMIVIGYYLAKAKLLERLKDKNLYITLFLRLVISPMIALVTMVMFGLKGTILISCVISASAPVAAANTMFTEKFGQDVELSVSLVALSTVLSIITMPIIVGLAGIFI